MSALDRWRERCERDAYRASEDCGDVGIRAALVIQAFNPRLSSTELVDLLAKKAENPKLVLQATGLRLALTWLREEVERGE